MSNPITKLSYELSEAWGIPRDELLDCISSSELSAWHAFKSHFVTDAEKQLALLTCILYNSHAKEGKELKVEDFYPPRLQVKAKAKKATSREMSCEEIKNILGKFQR